MLSYSVLMSVYQKESAQDFQKSIQSMIDQTVQTDDFVIVCDGPLTESLDGVIQSYTDRYPTLFTIVRLDTNHGIGYAANIGLEHCKHEIILKMDADDIALPHRSEVQLAVFEQQPDIDLVGSYISEFIDSPDQIISVRRVPLDLQSIRTYAKRRNPFNNQSIAYKKQKAIECGGYAPLKRCEDYDFLVRMLEFGAVACNIPESLVYYRLSKDAYRRRNDWANTQGFIHVRYRIWKRGFSGLLDFLVPSAAQIVLFVMPSAFTQWLYEKMLRKGSV